MRWSVRSSARSCSRLAKQGFVGYVSNANYSKIYGALATIPIFLFWLYIVWTVVLFGASLAASLTTFSERVNLGDWPDKWGFQLMFRLTGHLWSAQREGESVSTRELLQLEEQASERQVLALLQQLMQARIVTLNHDDAGCWPGTWTKFRCANSIIAAIITCR